MTAVDAVLVSRRWSMGLFSHINKMEVFMDDLIAHAWIIVICLWLFSAFKSGRI